MNYFKGLYLQMIRQFWLICLFLSLASNLKGQWINTNGPSGAFVSCFAKSDSFIFAGTHNGGGIFASNDSGNTWLDISNGLSNKFISSLAADNQYLYAGTLGSGIYMSFDSGNSWNTVNMGLTNMYVYSLVIMDSLVFASTAQSGLFVSTNHGSTWTPSGTGLNGSYVYSLCVVDTTIFAGTSNGVFTSTDYGNTWSAMSNGLPVNSPVRSITFNGTNLYLITSYDLFIFNSNLNSWINTTNGSILSLKALGFCNSYLYLSTNYGIYKSPDNGVTWNPSGNGIADPLNNAFLSIDSTIIAASSTKGVYRSDDNGNSWSISNNHMSCPINSMAVIGTKLFAATDHGLFSTSDSGAVWESIDNGIGLKINNVVVSGNNLLVSTNAGIYVSSNNGTSWSHPVSNLTRNLDVNGNFVFAATNDGVKISSDFGITWNTTSSPLDVNSIGVSGTNLFINIWGGGIYRSTDNGNSWSFLNTGLSLFSAYRFTGNGTHVFAVGIDAKVSSDNGDTWNLVSNIPATNIYSIHYIGSNLYCCADNDVCLSTDNGLNWVSTGGGITTFPVQRISSVAEIGAVLFAGTSKGVFLKTTFLTYLQESTNTANFFEVFPNPANQSENILIKFNRTFEQVNLSVYSATGQQILTKQYSGFSMLNFQLPLLKNGLYFISIWDGTYRYNRKLVVIKG